MERGLIRIAGKAKVLGSPFLYATTDEFLRYLGLESLKDLPALEELETLMEAQEAAHDSKHPEETPPEGPPGTGAGGREESSGPEEAPAGEAKDRPEDEPASGGTVGSSPPLAEGSADPATDASAPESENPAAENPPSPPEAIASEGEPREESDGTGGPPSP
jgi:hypothetical protein